MTAGELGERVKALRRSKNLRQKDLADLVGCSIQHISAIERGSGSPSPDLVRKLETELGVPSELISLLRQQKVPDLAPGVDLVLTAHLFFPVMMEHNSLIDAGADPFGKTSYRSKNEPANSLHVFPFGVAVAHESHRVRVGSLTELATWRAQQLTRKSSAASEHLERHAVGRLVLSSDPYCLVCFSAHELPWTDARRNRAIQLMACLSLLRDAHGDADREQHLLNGASDIPGAHSFGLPDSHTGWATWAGVAMYVEPARSLNDVAAGQLEEALIVGEIELQAIWCYASHVAETGTPASPEFGVTFLRAARRRLTNPSGTEHTSRRLLREALVETSRIREVIEAALDALV